jgi:hypothetical protein
MVAWATIAPRLDLVVMFHLEGSMLVRPTWKSVLIGTMAGMVTAAAITEAVALVPGVKHAHRDYASFVAFDIARRGDPDVDGRGIPRAEDSATAAPAR